MIYFLPTVSVSAMNTCTFFSLYSTVKCSILLSLPLELNPAPDEVLGPGPDAEPGSKLVAASITLESAPLGTGSLKILKKPVTLVRVDSEGGGTLAVGESAMTFCTAC